MTVGKRRSTVCFSDVFDDLKRSISTEKCHAGLSQLSKMESFPVIINGF